MHGRIYLESVPFYPLEGRRPRSRHSLDTMTPRCPKCSTPLIALQGSQGPVWSCDCCLAAHRRQRKEAAA